MENFLLGVRVLKLWYTVTFEGLPNHPNFFLCNGEARKQIQIVYGGNRPKTSNKKVYKVFVSKILVSIFLSAGFQLQYLCTYFYLVY